MKMIHAPIIIVARYNYSWLNGRRLKSDLSTASKLGIDIVSAFNEEQSSVMNFEDSTGVKLPEDIMSMLSS